ncbi:uncharacterized protein LOC144169541 [Haemaphysalis longicornis]
MSRNIARLTEETIGRGIGCTRSREVWLEGTPQQGGQRHGCPYGEDVVPVCVRLQFAGCVECACRTGSCSYGAPPNGVASTYAGGTTGPATMPPPLQRTLFRQHPCWPARMLATMDAGGTQRGRGH